MNTDNYAVLVQMATLILSIMVGFGGIVPIVNKLKAQDVLGISGRRVQILAAVVAFLLALLMGIAQGLLVPESFTVEQFTVTIGIVLTLSQTEYQRWARKNQTGREVTQ